MQHQTARHSGDLCSWQEIAQAIQQLIELHHSRFRIGGLLWRRQAVNREWTKAERARLAVCVQRIVRSTFQSRLRYENWIARNLIPLYPIFEIGPVNVGRVKIDTGCSHPPNLQIIRMRSATRILAGPFQRRRKLRIDVRGKRVFALAGMSDTFDVDRIVPRHENFVRALSKHRTPVLAMFVKVRRQFWRELKTLGRETSHQRVWHAFVKESLCLC